MKAIHFPTAEKFRAWLEKHHATHTELEIGFYKKSTGLAGMTYREAVDEALCFGWIDGVIRKIDAQSYSHRFTPRQPASIWSKVNIARVARLALARRMHPAGTRAFEARKPDKTGIYSFEQKNPSPLPAKSLRKFKANKAAWTFFTAQAPWYQRKMVHKINRGKKEETRQRWLDSTISASAAMKRL